MILFINVLLTDNRLHGGHQAGCYYRGFLPASDKVDIFKYSMASFALIDRWSQVYINFELDEPYKSRELELMDYLGELFQKYPTVIQNRRYFDQADWQEIVSEIMDLEDQYVWFFCNHDHIFIDSDLDYIDRSIGMMEVYSEPHVSVYPTHLPEMLSMSDIPNELDKKIGFTRFYHPCLDSVQLINKNLLYYWWFSKTYDHGFGRTDYLEGVNPITYPILVPLYREIVRHFDGYNVPNRCPALAIPEGFFENDIKIRYGYADRKPGWTQVNPMYPDYRDCCHNGVDLKVTIDRLPLFWKDRISDVDTNSRVDMTAHLKAAKEAFILAVKSKPIVHTVTDDYFSEME